MSNLSVSSNASPLVTDKKSIPISNIVQSSIDSSVTVEDSSFPISSGSIKLTRQSRRNKCGIIERYLAIKLFFFTFSPIVGTLSFSDGGISGSLEEEVTVSGLGLFFVSLPSSSLGKASTTR